MELQINKDWRFVTDSRNFILEKSRVIDADTTKLKKGDIVWDFVGAYGMNFEWAARGLVTHAMLDSQATEVRAIIDELRVIDGDIKKLTAKLDVAIKEGIFNGNSTDTD